jgi:hypothetical protein
MKKKERYYLNNTLGGVISFGSYFFLSILVIFTIISLINSRIFFTLLFGFIALLYFFLFFKKKLRYRNVSFDENLLYIGDDEEKIDLKNVISISKGSIRYSRNNDRKEMVVKFFYTPNENYQLLIKFKKAIQY